MLKNAPSTFILVSGFHRSGTSLVAKTLEANGVSMGNSLMGASFANKEGHYEDIPLVNIHDAMLAANGTNWQETQATSLETPAFLNERLHGYLEARTSNNATMVGAKDPRALFFKQQWLSTPNISLKSLLVFRSWQYSVSSLLKRHSRELLQTSSLMRTRPVDYRFWQEPELAAKMWLTSARAILDWKRAAPEDTLVFPLSSLLSGSEALAHSLNNIGLPSDLLNAKNTVNGKLLHSQIPSSVSEMLSQTTIDDCEQLNEQLNNAFGNSDKERVTYYQVDSTLAINESEFSENENEAPNRKIDLSKFEFNDALKLINTSSNEGMIFEWQSLFNYSDTSAEQYEKLFFAAIKRNALETAELAIRRAIDLQPASWRWMYLGDIHMRLGRIALAAQCYVKAKERTPENATYYAKLADVAIIKGDISEASQLIKTARALDPEKPAVKHVVEKLSQICTAQEHGGNKAHQAAPLYKTMKVVTDYADVVEVMTEDFRLGEQFDNYVVKTAFVLRNNQEWLLDGLSGIPALARQNLLDYLSIHAQKLWSKPVLDTEFNLEHTMPSKRLNVPVLPILNTHHQRVRLGVHIHAFYPDLLPEIYEFLRCIPVNFKTIVTCPFDKEKEIKRLLEKQPFTQVVGVANKGRDIAPWLMVGAKLLRDCTLVLKLHTKRTLHANSLNGWRLQLLWALMGSEEEVLSLFERYLTEPRLGVVMPEYHPHILRDINWGKNKHASQIIANRLEMNIDCKSDVLAFPAGSMFWYRPACLSPLIDTDWSLDSFPDEEGQTDGTVMHAIERLIPYVSVNGGYINEWATPRG